jgi:hypothetical protein
MVRAASSRRLDERIRWGRGATGRGRGRRLGAAHVPAAAVGGAAVAGGGADGAGPLQGEREVVELPLRLAAQWRAGGAQVGQTRGDQHPHRQHARRRHRLPLLLCLRQLSSVQQLCGATRPKARWGCINSGGGTETAVSLQAGPCVAVSGTTSNYLDGMELQGIYPWPRPRTHMGLIHGISLAINTGDNRLRCDEATSQPAANEMRVAIKSTIRSELQK